MALIEINWNPSRREARQFAIYWLPAFLLVAGFVAWFKALLLASYLLWGAAIVVSLVGTMFPSLRRPIFVSWMCAMFPIGWVISHLLMAVIFYLLITPLGWMLRLFGHDPLKRKFDRNATTYWVPHARARDKASYFRQF